MIRNIRDQRPLPVYGEGVNVRDCLWVEDHASAIDVILHKGAFGRTYNIGGLNEWRNIDLVHELIRLVDAANEQTRRDFEELDRIRQGPSGPRHALCH